MRGCLQKATAMRPNAIFFLLHCGAKPSNYLGDPTTVAKTKSNANQMSTFLLNEWPGTIAKTMTTATKFIKFSWLFCFRHNFSSKNITQSGNSSNYSYFADEYTATNCSVLTVHASVGLTKIRFGHYIIGRIFFLQFTKTEPSPSNGYQKSKLQDPLKTDHSIFLKTVLVISSHIALPKFNVSIFSWKGNILRNKSHSESRDRVL